MTERDFFNKYRSTELSVRVNYSLLPVNIIDITDAGMEEFNELLEFLYNSDYAKIERTPSGGISTNVVHFLPPMYDVRSLRSCIELTVVADRMFRVQFRSEMELKKGEGISGAKAFQTFKTICQNFNVDLESFAVDNGAEIKSTIPAPRISLDQRFIDLPLDQGHHIDIHSAYMASIAEAFPELRPPIEYIYNKRKDLRYNLPYKAILTHSFGYFQSKMLNYRFANLSKAAIVGTLEKLDTITHGLEKNGNLICAYNTDGIWYLGDEYHGPGEGENLGFWENDHATELLVFKSVGTYGYIENGKFTPVVRGLRALDKLKPRSQWSIDDLDNLGATFVYTWDGKYIAKGEENEEY